MNAEQLIRELERTRDETLGYFKLSDRDLAKTYAPGKWSVAFLLHHLTDSETVLYERVRRVISEQPKPVLWYYHEDAWAKALDYGSIPLETSRAIYSSVRAGVIHAARKHYDAKGHLEWVHSQAGLRTLKDEFDKVATHNEHHLTQIRQALA